MKESQIIVRSSRDSQSYKKFGGENNTDKKNNFFSSFSLQIKCDKTQKKKKFLRGVKYTQNNRIYYRLLPWGLFLMGQRKKKMFCFLVLLLLLFFLRWWKDTKKGKRKVKSKQEIHQFGELHTLLWGKTQNTKSGETIEEMFYFYYFL